MQQTDFGWYEGTVLRLFSLLWYENPPYTILHSLSSGGATTFLMFAEVFILMGSYISHNQTNHNTILYNIPGEKTSSIINSA